jgi:hypothetical protein
MADYSYYTFEDGWLHTRGLHCHDFPLLLQDTLVQIGYGVQVLEYRGRLYEENGLPRCEVYIDIRSHPVFPDGSLWSTWVVRNDMDDAMEKAAHVPLTALCSQNLPATTGTPISLYLIQDHSDQSGRHARMMRATSFRTTTIVAGCTWQAMPSTCSSCSMTHSISLRDT